MVIAKWRQGYAGLFNGADPQKVNMELSEIGEKPTAQDIVDKARDGSTELHKCFEWNDSIAAERFRLQQAYYVTHHLVIEEKEVPKDRPEIRVMFMPKGEHGYVRTEVAYVKQDEHEKILARAYAELRAFKEKYKMLTELKEIFDLID